LTYYVKMLNSIQRHNMSIKKEEEYEHS